MLQLDQKDSGIAIGHPESVVLELTRDTARRVHARRTTDALRLRARETGTALDLDGAASHGRAELLVGLTAPNAWIASNNCEPSES